MKMAKSYARHGGRLFAVASLVAGLSGLSPAMANPVLSPDVTEFAVLAGTGGVTNVAPSSINGDLGSTNPTPAVNGTGYVFGSGGTLQAGTPLAVQAQLDFAGALSALSGLSPITPLASANLGGLILAPGIYSGASSLSGNGLTLQGDGAAGDSWVFLTGGLTVAAGESVTMLDIGTGASLYWDDSSSVTLGADTTFLGNILAATSVVAGAGATDSCGRLLAGTAVTLDQNTIGIDCSSAGLAASLAGSDGLSGAGSSGGNGSGGGTSVPEPSTLVLLAVGLLGLLGVTVWRRQTGSSRG